MICLSGLDGQQIALDPDLIERGEATPGTVLTLVDGTKYTVAESLPEVVARVRLARASMLAAAKGLSESASGPPAERRRATRPRSTLTAGTPIRHWPSGS